MFGEKKKWFKFTSINSTYGYINLENVNEINLVPLTDTDGKLGILINGNLASGALDEDQAIREYDKLKAALNII